GALLDRRLRDGSGEHGQVRGDDAPDHGRQGLGGGDEELPRSGGPWAPRDLHDRVVTIGGEVSGARAATAAGSGAAARAPRRPSAARRRCESAAPGETYTQR